MLLHNDEGLRGTPRLTERDFLSETQHTRLPTHLDAMVIINSLVDNSYYGNRNVQEKESDYFFNPYDG